MRGILAHVVRSMPPPPRCFGCGDPVWPDQHPALVDIENDGDPPFQATLVYHEVCFRAAGYGEEGRAGE